MSEPRKLSWRPRRRGAIYCSSACGGGCTWAAYQKAQVEAKALAEKLGPGWAAHVRENLGWYYYVVNGGLSVHPGYCGGPPYYAMLTDEPGLVGCGASYWTDPNEPRFADPREAVKYTIQKARAFVTKIGLVVTKAEVAAKLTRWAV